MVQDAYEAGKISKSYGLERNEKEIQKAVSYLSHKTHPWFEIEMHTTLG